MPHLPQWATEPTTSHAPPPQPNRTPRPFRVWVHGQRAVRVHAPSAFQAVCIVLGRKGLRYVETRFRVEEVNP